MNILVAVDLQNDFMPRGALPVTEGDAVLPVINSVQTFFDLVVATQDWHPPNHGSFAANHPGKSPGDQIILGGIEQILWPVHCVQHSHGAAFHPAFDRSRVSQVFYKGIDPVIDSYSTFFDNAHKRHTGLDAFLRKQRATAVYLAGLALDYCVLYSALDARQLGYETFVLVDGCRGINLQPGDIQRALDRMQQAGIHLVQSRELRQNSKSNQRS